MGQQLFNRNQVPLKGLYTSMVSDAIEPVNTPWCQNVRFRFGQVLKCPGRSVALSDRSPRYIMDFAQYTDAGGVKSVLSLEASSLTDNSACLYDPNAISFGAPVGLQNAQLDRRFSWAAGEERLLVVRASPLNAIYRNPGTGVFTNEAVASPAALFVEYFKNHTVLMNIIGNSNRIQWSALAQYNDWATTTGHGGFLDLYDGTVEEITNGKILADRLVVYRKSSITDIVATGDPENPFLPEGRVYGLGCLAPWTLVNLGQSHVFLANDFNVYTWDGVNLNPIGTPIHSYIRQLYDPSTMNSWITTPFAAAFVSYKEYWLVLSQLGSGQYVALIYDYLRDTWTRDVFTNLYSIFEQSLPGATTTAGYNGTGYPASYPVLMTGMNHDYLMIDERIDGGRYTRPADGGIDMFVDTPDMYYDEKAMQNATLERVMVSEGAPRSTGEPAFQLEVSIDRGNTFATSQDVQPLDVHWGFEFSDLNITSNVRRYRFNYPKERGAAAPTLRAYTEVYVPSGEFFPVNRPIGTFLNYIPPTGVDTRKDGVIVGEDAVVPPTVRRHNPKDIRSIPRGDDEPDEPVLRVYQGR